MKVIGNNIEQLEVVGDRQKQIPSSRSTAVGQRREMEWKQQSLKSKINKNKNGRVNKQQLERLDLKSFT